MPKFEITANGATYEIEAPDHLAAVAALGQIGTQKTEAPQAAAEPKSVLQTIREALHGPTRALENGLLMGLGDRARAAAGAAIGDGSYAGNLKQENAESDRFAAAHPIAAPALEAAGGVLGPLASLGAAAKGTSLAGRMGYGAAAGTGIGATQGALSSRDYTEPAQVAKDAGMGGATGFALGGAMPALAKGAASGITAVANALRGKVDGMSRGAGAHLVRAMEADTPQAVRARAAELGEDAMLGDLGPANLGKLQGASLNSDEGRSIAKNALTTRDKGTNQRIMSDVDAALGPAQDEGALSASDRIRRYREEQDAKAYPAALDNAPPVKIAPIMTELVDRISQTPAGSMEHKALTNLQGMLTKKVKEPLLDSEGYSQYDKLGNERFKDVAYSHDSAEVLHKVKGELDNVIEYDAPGLGVPAGALSRQQAALKQMRFAINNALEDQVPGYVAANRASAALAKRVEAVKAGTSYLGNGKETPTPQRFAFDFEGLSQGEKIALAKGSRAEIDRLLGTQANDLVALKRSLQGEGGYNQAKLGTVHGADAAQELADSVNRNAAFRQTHSDVVANSMTASRTAASNAMKPIPPGELPLIGPSSNLTGMLATGAKRLVNAAAGQLRSDPTATYGEVARALTEKGSQRDQRIAAIVQTLDRRQGNSLAAAKGGEAIALLSAIAAQGAARRRREQK